MKLLWIGTQLGFSGYSAASRGYIRALYKEGVDLVLRNIKYDAGYDYPIEDWARPLYKKATEDIDLIIEHLTANELSVKEGNPHIKHVALLATETDLIPREWAQSVSRMDAVVTFCQMSADAIKKAGVTIPVYVVPHTFEIDSYKKVEPFQTMTGIPLTGTSKPCIFYNISQISHKKGIDKLLRAYYGAFRHQEPVALILKGYIGQMKRVDEEKKIMDFINNVKDGCRLQHYPSVIVFTEIMSDDEIKRVHSTGDIYVNASSGESFGIPVFEAAAYGNAVISPLWGGPSSYLTPETAYPVEYSIEPVYGVRHGHHYMYSSYENWAEPSVASLIEQMRLAYGNYMNLNLKKVTDLSAFDDKIVGPQLKEVFETIRLLKKRSISQGSHT